MPERDWALTHHLKREIVSIETGLRKNDWDQTRLPALGEMLAYQEALDKPTPPKLPEPKEFDRQIDRVGARWLMPVVGAVSATEMTVRPPTFDEQMRHILLSKE